MARVFIVRCSGHAEAGCFILAYGFVGYLQMFSSAFSVPLVPKWSHLARKHRRSKLLRDIRNIVTSMLCFGGGYGVILFLFAPWFIPAIYGIQYDSAIALVRILALTCPIIGIGFASWVLSISQGRVKVVVWANVVWSSTLTLSAFLLVPGHGAAGAAMAVLIAYVCWGLVYSAFLAVRIFEIASWRIGQK